MTYLENKELIDLTNSNLKRLNLTKAWLASQLDVTPEYIRKILIGYIELSKILKQRLIEFNEKLEQISKILAA